MHAWAQIAIAVARLQAVALQRGGDAVHHRIELAIAQALVAAHQRGGVGARTCVRADQIGQGLEIGQRLGGRHDNGLGSGTHHVAAFIVQNNPCGLRGRG